jgi:hypothetical protein
MSHELNQLNQAIDAVITSMQPDPKVPIYVLGCFARRVTLYTQQVRALNLIYALKQQGRLGPGTHLGIIGGGAAGLTAAALAAYYGCKVTVLEKHGDPLPFFTGNGTRWLHPHIYDWPAPDSLNDDAGLMVLNWRAGLADDVADQLIDQWEPLKESYGIRFEPNIKNLRMDGLLVTWEKASGGDDVEDFNAIVVAVGFGLERNTGNPDIKVKSYWRNDSLHQFYFGMDRAAHGRKDILISGSGDGGLIDLLRTGLKRFRHQRIVKEFGLDQDFDPELRKSLLQIEEDIQHQSDPGRWLIQKYSNISNHPFVRDTLVEQVANRRRADTKVYLNFTRMENLYSLNACALNRFLLLCMIKAGQVGLVTGKINPEEVERNGEKFSIPWTSRAAHMPSSFDIIILRHGPVPALKSLPDILRLYPSGDRLVQLAMSNDPAAFLAEMDVLRDQFARYDRRELIMPDEERERVHREMYYRLPQLGPHIGLPRMSAEVVPISRPLHKDLYTEISGVALRSEDTLRHLIDSLLSWRQTTQGKKGLFYADFNDRRISHTVSAIALLALNDRRDTESQFICDALLDARSALDKPSTTQASSGKKRRKNKAKIAWRNTEGNAAFHTMATTWPIFSCLETRPSSVRELKDSVNWLISQRAGADNGRGPLGWGHTKHSTPHAYYTTYALNALMKYDECFYVGYGTAMSHVREAIVQGIDFLEQSRASGFNKYCFWWVPETGESSICIATTIMSLHAMMKYQQLYQRPVGISMQVMSNTIRLICDLIKSRISEQYIEVGVEHRTVRFCMWTSFTSKENYRHHFFTPLLAIHLMELLVDLGINYSSSLSTEVRTLINYINDHTKLAHAEQKDFNGKFYIPNKFNEKADPRPVWSTALGAFVLRRWMDEVKKPLVGTWNSGSVNRLTPTLVPTQNKPA